MDCYQVALFVALALVLQCHQLRATDCNRRTTFIQIRIPQRTNVAIKYPKEISAVQFVPFPYTTSESQCFKCQDSTCNKCTNNKPPTHSTAHARKTNIVIDIKGTRKLNESAVENRNKNANNSGTVDGTIVGIYDKTSAVSKSGATAATGDKGNSSAATASGTTLSQSDTLAAVNVEETNKDNGEKSHVEDIYAMSEDGSTADANSTAASEPDKKGEPSKDELEKKSDSSNTKPSGEKKTEKDSSDKAPAETKSSEENKTKEDPDKVPKDPASSDTPSSGAASDKDIKDKEKSPDKDKALETPNA